MALGDTVIYVTPAGNRLPAIVVDDHPDMPNLQVFQNSDGRRGSHWVPAVPRDDSGKPGTWHPRPVTNAQPEGLIPSGGPTESDFAAAKRGRRNRG